MSARFQMIALAIVTAGFALVAVFGFLGAASVRSEVADLRAESKAQSEALAAEIETIEVVVPEEALSVSVSTDELVTIDAAPLVEPLVEADAQNRDAIIGLTEALSLMASELGYIADDMEHLAANTPLRGDNANCHDAGVFLDSLADDLEIISHRIENLAEFEIIAMYVNRINTLQLLRAIWNCPNQQVPSLLVGFYNS